MFDIYPKVRYITQMKQVENIRLKCKFKMAELGIDKRGGQKMLATKLGISYPQLGYALNGTRTTRAYLEILDKVHNYLILLDK